MLKDKLNNQGFLGLTIPIAGLCFALVFGPFFMFIGAVGDEFSSELFYTGLVMFIIGIPLTYIGFTMKKKVAPEVFEQIYVQNTVKALIDKCDTYVKEVKTKDKKTFKQQFINLNNYYYDYGINLLNQKLMPLNHVSSDTAGMVGTLVGGVTLGVAATIRQERKIERAKEMEKEAISDRVVTKSSYDKMLRAYDDILDVVEENDKLKKDWEETEQEIIDKLNSEYSISTLWYLY